MGFYVLHHTVSRFDIHNVTLINMYAYTLVFITFHTTTSLTSHQHDIEGRVEILFTVYTVNIKPYNISPYN